MANKLIDTLTMPDGVSYDIEAKYFGGLESTDFAKVSDLADKADVYRTFTVKKLSEVRAGDNLSGVTLVFDTGSTPNSYNQNIYFKKKDSGLPTHSEYKIGVDESNSMYYGLCTFVQMASDGGWYVMDYSGLIDSNAFHYGLTAPDRNWLKNSFTIPTSDGDDWVVERIYNTYSSADGIFNAISYETVSIVDPEYNYNEIQTHTKSKANIYEIGGDQNPTASVNLAGKTISGVPGKILDLNVFGSTEIILTGSNGASSYKIRMGGAYGEPVLVTLPGEDYVDANEGGSMYFYHGYDGQDGQYSGLSYTFPNTGEIYMSDNDFLEYFNIPGYIAIDCEYNYINKADKYNTTAQVIKKLSDIKVGDNLSGATIVAKTDTYVSGPDFKIVFGNYSSYGAYRHPNDIGAILGCFTSNSSGPLGGAYCFGLWSYNGAYGEYLPFGGDDYNSPSLLGWSYSDGTYWRNTSYTFPVVDTDEFVVTEIPVAVDTYDPGHWDTIAEIHREAPVVVDCEYNYNEIQNLKAEIENLETGSSSSTQAGNGIYYGTCSTAYNTAAKTVTVDDSFELKTGAVVAVKFTSYNSASNPTLNVNNTGDKRIYAYGTTTTGLTASRTGWQSNAIVIFVYDGSAWIRNYWTDTDTYPTPSNASQGQGYGTCTTAANTTAKTVSLTNYALSTGGIVTVKFDYDVPAAATLNINSKGAKNIYHKGSTIAAGIIKAGDTATFIYNGSYYHLLCIDNDAYCTNKYITTGENDLVNLQVGDVAGEGCAIYFPAGNHGDGTYFYGSSSAVLSNTLVTFSDGTRIYGKPEEGWALYIYYNGKEETLWSSGGWMDEANLMRTADRSKYILPKGTAIVENNAEIYIRNNEFMLSNIGPATGTIKDNLLAIQSLNSKVDKLTALTATTSVETPHPNFSSNTATAADAISGKIISWDYNVSQSMTGYNFAQRFYVYGYTDTSTYPATTTSFNVQPEIWMRAVKLGTGGYAYVFAEFANNGTLLTLGVCEHNKTPLQQNNPTMAGTSDAYAATKIKLRSDGVHILYDSTNPNIRDSYYFPIGSRVVNEAVDNQPSWLIAFSDSYSTTSSISQGVLKNIALSTGEYPCCNQNWALTSQTFKINEEQVRVFSQLFNTTNQVQDSTAVKTVYNSSTLSTRSSVLISSSDVNGTSSTVWHNLPSLTIDITKERLAGISIKTSVYDPIRVDSTPAIFTMEELLALGIRHDLAAANIATSAFPFVEYGVGSGSITGCQFNTASKVNYPLATYNLGLKFSWGSNTKSYTVAYVVETFDANYSNNSNSYTY